jgi:hypothetical protein
MTRSGTGFEMSRPSHVIATAVLALLSASSAAQQGAAPGAAVLGTEDEEVRRYAVELIVFEYAGSAAESAEQFQPEMPVELLDEQRLYGDPAGEGEIPVFGDPTTPLAEAGSADDIAASAELPTAIGAEESSDLVPIEEETLETINTYEGAGVEFVDPEQHELTAAYARLERLDAYRPLMHVRWIQPAVEEDASMALELRRIGNPPLRLDGTVTLYVGRFVHLDLDLSLEDTVMVNRVPSGAPEPFVEQGRPAAPEPTPDPEQDPYPDPNRYGGAPIKTSVYYRIREDRIMRNNETRYFDHPKFGVIAKLVRVEEAAPEAFDTTDDLLPGASAR